MADGPIIGRKHLDDAFLAGQLAGRDPVADSGECPFVAQEWPMKRHAWLRGFAAARADPEL